MMRHPKITILAVLVLWACSITGAFADPGQGNSQQESSEISEDADYDESELEEEVEAESAVEPFDPLSGYNRFMTQVNDKLYFWIMKPIGKGYAFVVPECGRLAVDRCFKNILFPVRFVNNLLQLKIEGAGIETARFAVNTTVGVLGFGDPAKNWLNLNPYVEDFGQTLGHYGLGGGFHLVWPILGPSNIRDTIGLVPDYFLNPISYVEPTLLASGIRIFDKVNYTSLHIGEYESIKKDTVDLYGFMRDAYEENRKKEIAE
jgi:phospholipid-binding lipoprotein MlaA